MYRGDVKDVYAITKRTIGVCGVEPHAYSQEEYRAMRGTIRRMIEGGVIIFMEDGFDS